MDRKEFIKTCGMFCLGTVGMSALMQSCATTHYYAANELSGQYIKVKLTEFTLNKNQQAVNRRYVLVRSEQLKFPIFLYKISNSEYSALWMECTHMGAELSAHGDYLVCPAHGSEFDKTGQVMQG